jgi:hypothetical protein
MIVSQKRDMVMILGEVYNPNAGPQHRLLFAVSLSGPVVEPRREIWVLRIIRLQLKQGV